MTNQTSEEQEWRSEFNKRCCEHFGFIYPDEQRLSLIDQDADVEFNTNHQDIEYCDLWDFYYGARKIDAERIKKLNFEIEIRDRHFNNLFVSAKDQINLSEKRIAELESDVKTLLSMVDSCVDIMAEDEEDLALIEEIRQRQQGLKINEK